MLTIIIPAHNEDSVIAGCLKSLIDQSYAGPVQVIVAANGCIDQTVLLCQSFRSAFHRKGYEFEVMRLVQSGKNNALNQADKTARYGSRLYLDADVICDEHLLQQAVQFLDSAEPVYFSGALAIKPGSSFFSNAYGKIWQAMPYIREAVIGIGCYGVNEAGRKKWGDFPSIHSDDKFVRLLFARHQCNKTEARYYWPVPQGLLTLIKVRIRWIRGNRQLKSRFPDLGRKDSGRMKVDWKLCKTTLTNPLSTLVFLFVYGVSAGIAALHPEHLQIGWSRAR